MRTATLLRNLTTNIMILGSLACWCQDTEPEIHQLIQHGTDKIYNSLVDIRRDIHRNPEIAGEEERTSSLIAKYLANIGLDVKREIGGHGVIGILSGEQDGGRIAWRADIDALRTDFPDVVEFKSQVEGIRHICGHDVHTVIALGIANVLSRHRDRLRGTVYFIFQPAEENIQGARAMIEDGLFGIVEADEIYALHISPFPVGTISTKPDEIYGDYRRIEVTIEKNSDSPKTLQFVKDRISELQQVNNPAAFNDPSTLGDPVLGIASPETIFKEYISLSPRFYVEESADGTLVSTHISSSSKDRFESAKEQLKENINASRYARNIQDIDFVPVTYTPDNEDSLVEETTKTIVNVYGGESLVPLYGLIPGGTGDDFALFQEHVPGVYYFLGGSNFEAGKIAMPHTPDFEVDEKSIGFGVKYFSSMMVEQLAKKN